MGLQAFRQHRQIAARLARWADGGSILSRSCGTSCSDLLDLEMGRNTTAPCPSLTSWDDFDSDLDPKNWPVSRKLVPTLLVTAITFTVQFASTLDSAASDRIRAEFGASELVESLATGLFLLGFAIGAPVAGPLSEVAGRNPVYIASLGAFMCCTLGAGLAPNIGAQLACRFLAGVFGSTPLVCAGGTVADLWTPIDQIHIFPMYATGGFLGLAVGPAVGGIIAQSQVVGWRWVEWSTLILSGVVLVLVMLLQPETYSPVLLQWKAGILTAQAKAQCSTPTAEVLVISAAVVARRSKFHELRVTLGQALYRPIQLAVSEPIIIMISIYLAVIYIVIFTFLPGYTFIFTDIYSFGPALRGLSFLGTGVGYLLALSLVIPVTFVSRRLIRRRGELSPESRLYYAMCGAPAIPISMFWMGWTTRESISPWSAIAASVLFGFGILSVFFSSYQYIIHTYGQFAASGLVFVTLSRYLTSGATIVVGIPMYGNLGVARTMTVMGSVAGLLVPIPFCLFWFGPTIRKWSKHGMQ